METNSIYRGPSNVLDTPALDAGCRTQGDKSGKPALANMHSFSFLRNLHFFLSFFLLTHWKMPAAVEDGSESVTWDSQSNNDCPPDLRFLHFNDVYHIESVRLLLLILIV